MQSQYHWEMCLKVKGQLKGKEFKYKNSNTNWFKNYLENFSAQLRNKK